MSPKPVAPMGMGHSGQVGKGRSSPINANDSSDSETDEPPFEESGLEEVWLVYVSVIQF